MEETDSNCDDNLLQSTNQKVKVKGTSNNPWKGYPYNSNEIPSKAKPDEKILKHYLKKYIKHHKLLIDICTQFFTTVNAPKENRLIKCVYQMLHAL